MMGSLFVAGMLKAVERLRDEAHDLYDIRDGYIEAQRTGMHGGRRITPEMAKEFAVKFRERAEAVYMAADNIEREARKT